jgi:hypothetical protein
LTSIFNVSVNSFPDVVYCSLDRLDKAFLDQDSDEVSVSDDENQGDGMARKRNSLGPAQSMFGKDSNAGGPSSAVHPDLMQPVPKTQKLKPLRASRKGVDDDGEELDEDEGADDGGDEIDIGDGMNGRGEFDEKLVLRNEMIRAKKFPKSSEVKFMPSKKGEKSRSRRVMKSSKGGSSKGSSQSSPRKHLEMPSAENSLAGEEESYASKQQMDLSALGVTRAALSNAREFRANLADAKRTLGSEVRSYKDATQTAQQMLSKLPPPSAAAKTCVLS